MKNSSDNVFRDTAVGDQEAALFHAYLAAHDFSPHTKRAVVQDITKFAAWFASNNREPFRIGRVTVRDITDFRDHLRRERGQAVATVNRRLVSLRRFLGWLTEQGHIPSNPGRAVKELRRQQLPPKGLERSVVRRLLREVELRQDIRANAIFHLFLYTGCRVGDLVNLEIPDLMLAERSGTVIFRCGKGNKQRSVPLPLPARRGVQAYLEARPPVEGQKVFIGERGPLTDRGVRAICTKYSAVVGVKLHPHLFRHTFARQYLADNGNDLVGLAQLLGHENVNTTARYAKQTTEQLATASERLTY